MPNVWFDSMYDGIPLLITDITTQRGRDVETQSPARGNKHVRQDRGKRAFDAHATILFIDQPGLDPFLDRYDQFMAAAEDGVAKIFSHPLDGSYRALIADIETTVEGGAGQVRLTCTILVEDEPQTVFPIGAGTTPQAGLDAVTAAASTADEQLAAIGVSSSVPSASVSTVSDWTQDDSLDSNKVFAAVATLTSQISDAIDTYELATDITRWQAYQAMIGLSYQVSRAGEAFTSDSGHLFDITIDKPMPVLAICAEVYGAADAQDFAEKVTKLNRVRTPGRVPAGTTLKMPPRPT